jgi:carbamoyltransferase
MIILGINAYHGDVSGVVLRDGQLVAAVEEERFRRVKHWAGFPRESIRTCLELAGVAPSAVDHIAISRDPKANLLRKALFTLRQRPSPGLVWDRLRNSNRVRDVASVLSLDWGINREAIVPKLHGVEHHPAHLASAFFVSPFEEAAVCAIDGFGDFVSTAGGIGRGHTLQGLERVYFPHSLGLMYLAITQYLGFPNYGDEYKVMGLAPYGEPDFVEALRRLVHLKPGGGFELELAYFRHHAEGVSMTWDDGEPTIGPVYTRKLEELLGPARKPEEPLEARHEAIAASLQVVFEEAAFHVLNALYRQTRLPRLCLAGGCAMNSVMNGKIREQTPFEEVYIQPAAADNGTALGSAFYVWHQVLRQPRAFEMTHAYWGPEFSGEEIGKALRGRNEELGGGGGRARKIEDTDELCRWTAGLIADGKIVGWFQGRMEWGARALGNRSILADPRRPDMRQIINTKIKFREKFRPFAPSILEEALDEYFVGAVPDPFMIQVYPVRPEKRGAIPAVTHVDGSGRLQTVNHANNPLYWQLLKAFETLTGVPVLLNTSFNENEPIVHKPAEALDCFLRTQMDVLVMGKYVVEKES